MTFPIRAVFGLTGKLLRKGAVPLALVTVLLCYLPQQALHYGIASLAYTEVGRIILSAPVITGWVLLAVNQFILAFHLAAISEIALRIAAGKSLRPSKLLINALVNAIPLMVTQFALQTATLVGVLLLVIPGVFVGVALSVVVPTYVCEGKGIIESFRRAFQLTKGRRWGIFGIWLSIRIISFVAFPNTILSPVNAVFALARRLAPTLPLPDLPLGIQYGPATTTALGFIITLITTLTIVLNTAVYLTLRFHSPDQGNNTRVADVFE
ncbi:hypothetical protein [Asticcacaulis solisilvae]|uniref:hypothetical protein n=1 Tax=Asticcacaulis solisilvae TaxID=1217274 RepID=UPI003FD74737